MLCRSITSDSASGKVELVSYGWYMFESLRNLGLEMVEMNRPSGPCSSTEFDEVGVGGDLKCPCGYGIQIGVDRVGGIGCVAGEPSALAMRRGRRGRSCFLFVG